MNVGEQFVAEYLRCIKGCDFVETNLYTLSQGEIDVVGINLRERKVYLCEVAVHLTIGLQYVKNKQPNNVEKMIEKFERNIVFANSNFPDYEKYFMLWSPIVKTAKTGAKHNQMRDIQDIKKYILDNHSIDIDMKINNEFKNCITELKNHVKCKTEEMKSPISRFLQIEAYLDKHIGKSV